MAVEYKMSAKKDISVSSTALDPKIPTDGRAVKPSVYDDEEFAAYFQPVEKYEGKHRLDPQATWEPQEEMIVVRKIDKWILPWCCLMFMSLQLDRQNISTFLVTRLKRKECLTSISSST